MRCAIGAFTVRLLRDRLSHAERRALDESFSYKIERGRKGRGRREGFRGRSGITEVSASFDAPG